MPATALFFLPTNTPESSPTQDIVHRLSIAYEAIPLQPWTLSHRLFRETPGGTKASSQTQQSPSSPVSPTRDRASKSQRYLQILSMSHHAPSTYIAITSTTSSSTSRTGTPSTPKPSSAEKPGGASGASGPEPATIISVPTGGPNDEFTQLLLTKFGPLWQQRQVLHVHNGLTFDTPGGVRVRVGELRQGYSGGGVQLARGAICEIECLETIGEDGPGRADSHDEQERRAQTDFAVLKGFWDGLGIKGAREVWGGPGSRIGEKTVEQWCEVLRLRS